VEIRETAEEAVVAKSARVVEEVVVGKESSQRTEAVNDTVRGTEVEVERDTGTPAKGSTDPLKKKPL
jgi:stress response protein YsnF